MLAVLGAGAVYAMTLEKNKGKKMEKPTVKKRSHERAVHALQVILTTLGERVETLEEMLDNAMDRLSEANARETKAAFENRQLTGQLNAMKADSERAIREREDCVTEIERLRAELNAATAPKGNRSRKGQPKVATYSEPAA